MGVHRHSLLAELRARLNRIGGIEDDQFTTRQFMEAYDLMEYWSRGTFIKAIESRLRELGYESNGRTWKLQRLQH